MAYLGGVNLGFVQRESITITADIQGGLGAGTTDTNMLFDAMGRERKIDIEGIYTGTVEDVRYFIQQIENMINDIQTSIDYVSDVSGQTYQVAIQSFHYEVRAEEGEVTKVHYTLSLVEGML